MDFRSPHDGGTSRAAINCVADPSRKKASEPPTDYMECWTCSQMDLNVAMAIEFAVLELDRGSKMLKVLGFWNEVEQAIG